MCSNTRPQKQQTHHADLFGSDTCTVPALGVTTCTSNAPILEMCRKLIALGVPPDDRLECFRNGRLTFICDPIGKAAELEIAGNGIGFTHRKRRKEMVTAPPVRKSNRPATHHASTLHGGQW